VTLYRQDPEESHYGWLVNPALYISPQDLERQCVDGLFVNFITPIWSADVRRKMSKCLGAPDDSVVPRWVGETWEHFVIDKSEGTAVALRHRDNGTFSLHGFPWLIT
jgi:hypothetical protein